MNDETLWAPWRLGYITRDPAERQRELAAARSLPLRPGGDPGCFLCRAAVDSRDRELFVVARRRHVFAILNRYPYNNGHVLVAPLEHHGRLDAFSAEVHAEGVALIGQLIEVIERRMRAQGFNVGLNLGEVAGAGVPGHLHWHVVPRWAGDTNFMPVLAGVNVLGQSLEALEELLRVELAEPTAGGAA